MVLFEGIRNKEIGVCPEFLSDHQTFGITTPQYNVPIHEVNLKDTWYTLEGISGEFHFTVIEGPINQNGWDSLSEGIITIIFYAEDYAGNTDVKEVKVVKNLPPTPPIPGYYLSILLIVLIASSIIYMSRKKINQN